LNSEGVSNLENTFCMKNSSSWTGVTKTPDVDTIKYEPEIHLLDHVVLGPLRAALGDVVLATPIPAHDRVKLGKKKIDPGSMVLSHFTYGNQVCQIFIGTMYQNGTKYTQWPQNMSKIFQMNRKYSNI
jgi:hypothetical protein